MLTPPTLTATANQLRVLAAWLSDVGNTSMRLLWRPAWAAELTADWAIYRRPVAVTWIFMIGSVRVDGSLVNCLGVPSKHKKMWPNVSLIMARRRRRRANIKSTLVQSLEFAGYARSAVRHPSSDKTLKHSLFNVGPPSAMLAHHWIDLYQQIRDVDWMLV